MAAARYVERNPVRAGLVHSAEDWLYSSAPVHVETGTSVVRNGWIETDWLTDRTAGWVCPWREYLAEPDEAAIGLQLLKHENTGRPLGEKLFLKRVGALLGRNLVPSKGGRPKKQEGN